MHSLVVDMHYQTLCATGWTQQDANLLQQGLDGARSTTLSQSTTVGTYDLTVSSADGFAAGMMIAYQATGGEFYPAKIYKMMGGNVLRLDRPIVAASTAGAIAGPLYGNDAHPNLYGGWAVADDALRQLTGSRVSTFESRTPSLVAWSPVGGAAVTPNSSVSYLNVGDSSSGIGLTVDGNNPGGGVKSTPFLIGAGDHEALIPLNVGLRTGGYSGHVVVYVDETKLDGTTTTVGTSQPMNGYEGGFLARVKFTSSGWSNITVRVVTGNGGGYRFYVGALEFRRLGDQAPDLNKGAHVILADSWGVDTRPIPTRLAARLPGAQFFAAGVVGNIASQLLDRFDTDVTPKNPDFVWVIVGTNDFYRSITAEQFGQQINQIKEKIKAIGAVPIFLTPSVGAITFSPQQLSNSRVYAQSVVYSDTPPIEDLSSYIDSHASFQFIAPANTISTAWVFPSLFVGEAFLRFLLTNSPYVSVRMEYGTTSDGAGGKDVTVFPGATVVRDARLPRTNNQERLLAIRINNPQSFPVYVGGTASVAWPK